MMNDATPQEPEQETPDVTEHAAEFMNVPVDLIETGRRSARTSARRGSPSAVSPR